MSKAAAAFRTISEVAQELDVPKHVLRFWELKFPQLKPMKRGGGRRYYRPEDLEMLRGIRHLLYADGYTIKGVQKILRERGVQAVKTAPGAAGKQIHSSPTTATPETSDGPRSARAKGAGPPAKKRATTSKRSAPGKRAATADINPPALSAKSIKAVERVIKELRACRDGLHPQTKTRPPRAAKPKPRRARAQR